MVSLRNKIIELRLSGKTYDEIVNELKCSKATISYHCQRHDLGDKRKRNFLSDVEINELKKFYETHTVDECCKEFNIGRTTVHRYTDNKLIILSEEERKKRNYEKVKLHRQKIKNKAVEYKGGKCEKCGYNKCNWAFDFHHLDKIEKTFSISKYSSLSWDKIKKELDKCRMLCANCHRELHYQEYIDELYCAVTTQSDTLEQGSG